jgi:8-oxo-dGTP pyrophosphatase MutT (NUDIX family)
MSRLPIVHAFSAGGVVYRYFVAENLPPAGDFREPGTEHRTSGEVQATPQVILVGRAADDFWVLPKGTPEHGETTEQVALREVTEETGIQTRIVGKLGSIRYSFSRQGRRYSKEVLYFLMEAIGGDVSLHDHEYDDARWFALDSAAEHLAYTNEANVLRRAIPRIFEGAPHQTTTE